MHHKCAYIAIDDCRHNENNSAIISSNVCRSCKRIREYVWCIAVSLWMHHIGRQLGNKITKHALDSPINKQAIIRCRSAIFNILKCCMSWPTNQPTNRLVYLSICRFLSLFLPFAHYSLSLSLFLTLFSSEWIYPGRLSLSNKLDLILLIFVIYLKCSLFVQSNLCRANGILQTNTDTQMYTSLHGRCKGLHQLMTECWLMQMLW